MGGTALFDVGGGTGALANTVTVTLSGGTNDAGDQAADGLLNVLGDIVNNAVIN